MPIVGGGPDDIIDDTENYQANEIDRFPFSVNESDFKSLPSVARLVMRISKRDTSTNDSWR